MWRCDSGRTAATNQQLPSNPKLLWEREYARPTPTYPHDPRMCFDRSYEPVAAGQRIFVPSMVTDSVTALDTATGNELWRFFAEGPVRFAPVVAQDRVYFVSDDGFLYCVTAQAGKLLWRYSPMGSRRRTLKLLADERLISRWPARGGPVLADGVVYFAAGIWPFEGVAVCAVDAATGNPRWVNTECHFVKDGLLDHGDRRDGGVSPQGYLTVLEDKLIVPCGRALPAVFDRATGRMEPYTSGWGGRVALAKGSWYACGAGPWMFQSGDVYELHPPQPIAAAPRPDDFESVEDFARQMAVPPATVESWITQFKLQVTEREGRRYLQVRNGKEITFLSWWTSSKTKPLRPGEEQALATRTRLEIDPNNAKELGTFREPVVTSTAFYYSAPATDGLRTVREDNADRKNPQSATYTQIIACDLATPPQPVQTVQGGWGQQLVAWKGARFQQLWSLDSPLKIHIKAGNRLYAGAEGEIAAVDIPEPGKPATLCWKQPIAGTPSRMLAADDKLFVVTQDGRLYAFGAGNPIPATHPCPSDRTAPPVDAWTARATDLLQNSGTHAGYGLALGIGSGRLVHELVRQSPLRMIVLEPDAARASAARAELFERGLYGSRVQILTGDLTNVHPAPYLANLLVAEECPKTLITTPAALQNAYSLLRPYGGVAALPTTSETHQVFSRLAASSGLENAAVERTADYSLLRRPGPLPGAADWMHESGDGCHTYASGDQRLVAPLGILWFSGGLDAVVPWVEGDPPILPGEAQPSPYAGAGPRPRVAGGRMFIGIGDELFATDLYTGRFLWKQTIPALGDFAACEESVYVLSGTHCRRLDAATGKQTAAFPSPDGGVWRQIRVRDHRLAGTAGKLLLCLDRLTGAIQWQRSLKRDALGFALAKDRLFCVDYPSLANRRREASASQQCDIAALDLRDGRELWQTPAEAPAAAVPGPREFAPPLAPQLAFSETCDVLLFTRNAATASAYRGASGKLLWSREQPCKWPEKSFTSYHPPVVLGDRFITHGRDVIALETGEPCATQLWPGAKDSPRGCGRALGCSHLLLMRDAHATYYDLDHGEHTYLRGIRSGCTNSLVPAGGVLSAPNFSRHCNCNYPISTSVAFVTLPESEGWDQSSWCEP